MTALTKTDYEFGDEFEFDESPKEDDVFMESETFLIADLLGSTTDDKGFMKTAGGFVVIPNFETVLWYFRFQLEMPEYYFEAGQVMYSEITFGPTSNAFPAQTITCAVEFGNSDAVVVNEYDDSFTSVDSGAGFTIEDQNSSSLNAESSWSRAWDIEQYLLVPSINGKARQTCVAQVELPPEEAAFFFD